MSLTRTEETTPYDIIWLHRHVLYEVKGFIDHATSAHEINHATVVLHSWLYPVLQSHSIKIFHTLFN
ncbi:hypothetical protein ACJIZ3_001855 [Penstemon smallii]|uniref:Uncharacterized protein n=1 Tax=Penstemon smallii TaxID=265156 RepID=A0ABD3U5V6_9LAMI